MVFYKVRESEKLYTDNIKEMGKHLSFNPSRDNCFMKGFNPGFNIHPLLGRKRVTDDVGGEFFPSHLDYEAVVDFRLNLGAV